MTGTIVVDIGQTGARLRLTHGAAVVEEWRAFGAGADETAEASLLRLVHIALDRAKTAGLEVTTVAAGMTGLQGHPARAQGLLQDLASTPIRRVALADDALTSYLGAIGPIRGVVVAAGTGCVALATDGASRYARVDGWGHLVGDLGSGYWIGRAGITAALRAYDGRDGSTGLLRRLDEAYGDPTALPLRLASDPDRVRKVASFATAVAAEAGDGEPISTAILADAGQHLASSVHAAHRRLGLGATDIVSWSGSLFNIGELLLGPFRFALSSRLPDSTVVLPAGTSLDGAQSLPDLRGIDLAPLLTTAAAAATKTRR